MTPNPVLQSSLERLEAEDGARSQEGYFPRTPNLLGFTPSNHVFIYFRRMDESLEDEPHRHAIQAEKFFSSRTFESKGLAQVEFVI